MYRFQRLHCHEARVFGFGEVVNEDIFSGDVAIVVDNATVEETITVGVAVIISSTVVEDSFTEDYAFMGDLIVVQIIIVIESFALFQTSPMSETPLSLLDVMSEIHLTSKTKYDWKSRLLQCCRTTPIYHLENAYIFAGPRYP